MNNKKNIKLMLDAILFTKFLLYQDKFTSDELETGYDMINLRDIFIAENSEWIDEIKNIYNMRDGIEINISNSCLSYNGNEYFCYTRNNEIELYDYLINDLCDHYISENKMNKKDINEAIETIETELFEYYRFNLSFVNRILLDITSKYKVHPNLKRPLLTAI